MKTYSDIYNLVKFISKGSNKEEWIQFKVSEIIK